MNADSNAPADVPKIEVTTSRMFNAWLAGQVTHKAAHLRFCSF